MMTPVYLSIALLLNAAWVWSAPVITAPWGQISGIDATSPGGVGYSAYLAIPFALPPLGERRFAKPQPHPGPGAGRVFNASTPGYICPQLGDLATGYMSEDCLTLNVGVPANPSGSKSVMIWIHGGGFTQGSANEYIPSELITENDVIVVVIQYRLGILGFLSSGDDVSPGNYGLWDQTLAIRWVKDNIRPFGGDPDSMTIFGESAGAASVGYQILSPASRGLFSRAILQSGTPLTGWALNQDPVKSLYYLANTTGCLDQMSWSSTVYYTLAGRRLQAEHERVVECLRGVDWTRLLPFTLTEDVLSPVWVPSVDGEFLPRDPADLIGDADYLAANDLLSYDVMMGVNNEEGQLIETFGELIKAAIRESDPTADVSEVNMFTEEYSREFMRNELIYRFGEELLKEPKRLDTLVNVLDFFYTKPLENGQIKAKDIADAFSDIYFVVPTVKFARDLANATRTMAGRATTGRRYLYLFNHYPASKAGLEFKGMNHGEDILYQFDPNGFSRLDGFTADDYTVGTTFRLMLTNFAKTSQPQLALQTQVGGSWPEFRLEEEKYLSLEVTPRVEDYLYNKRVALWLDLVPALLNSTRPETRSTWYMPWQQSGWNYNNQYSSNYNNYYNNYQAPNAMAKTFSFKGRISFFKLP